MNNRRRRKAKLRRRLPALRREWINRYKQPMTVARWLYLRELAMTHGW